MDPLRPDHPDDDLEQPWDENEDSWEEDAPTPPWLPPKDMAEEGQYLEDAENELEELLAPYADFTEIPAWQKAHRYALSIARSTRQNLSKPRCASALIHLRRQSYLAAVDIANGHDEGYGPIRRLAHLEHCAEGLVKLHKCLKLLEILWREGPLPGEAYRKLFDETISVRDGLVHWMEQVRCL